MAFSSDIEKECVMQKKSNNNNNNNQSCLHEADENPRTLLIA